MYYLYIKTGIHKKVKEWVAQRWSERGTHSNYLSDSSRIALQSRFIQIYTALDDGYIHYEIINNHVELHFENSGSTDSGVFAHKGLIDYLERITETDSRFEWSDFLRNNSIRCCLLEPFVDENDVFQKLEFIIGYFDPLIEKYVRKSTQSVVENLYVDYSLSVPNGEIDLQNLCLKELLMRNLQIPSYQRIYCWEEKNVKCLLDDLSNHLEKKGSLSYRLGTIILHYHDSCYDIIDGQQRLVTLSLLLSELGLKTCLLKQKFDSSAAIQYVGYNKFLIKNYVDKHIMEKGEFLNSILNRIDFNVLVLNNSSIDLAYTFFSNENSRGVSLTDYDLLKAHHLRFIPDSFQQQAEKAAETWNSMVIEGQKRTSDDDPLTDYESTLDTYLFNLRKWMRKEHQETWNYDRHVKSEYEAAPIMAELPPFGERFYFNEPIQGGVHFFSYVQVFLSHYKRFVATEEYRQIHWWLAGNGSIRWFKNAIETLMFGYYVKFGDQCFADATVLIARYLLQVRYDSERAMRNYVYKKVAERGIILMLDQATSPTFFLAELYNVIRDFPVKYMQDMKPIQQNMRRYVLKVKNNLTERIYVESIKKMKL